MYFQPNVYRYDREPTLEESSRLGSGHLREN